MKTIDARGISCPQPLLMLKNALKTDKELILLVDSKNALENCREYAEENGCAVAVTEKGQEHQLTIKAKA